MCQEQVVAQSQWHRVALPDISTQERDDVKWLLRAHVCVRKMVMTKASNPDSTQTAFGLRNGRMYAPADVDAGLACRCRCAGCGAILVAKKGIKKRWHFAHHNVEIGESCAESAIHAAAKQVLLEQNWLRLPGAHVVISGQTMSGLTLLESSTLSEERIVRFERSCPEVWIDGIRPDVVGHRGERKLLVEMYFRHQVDDDKRCKLSQLNLPAIEVDLSDLDISTGFEAIRGRVLNETAHKSWLFFPGEEDERRRLAARLASRIEQANSEHQAKQAAEQERQAARQRKLDDDRKRHEAATVRYRQTSIEDKERDLRKRLGIEGRWPYYLRKESDGTSAITEPAMIWQGALFSRFIFRKANSAFELKQTSVLQWVSERFDVSNNSIAVAHAEVRRYLGYLSACGFLTKLPYNPYESQGYFVVHGELEPPARVERHQGALQTDRLLTAKVTKFTLPPAPGISQEQKERWMWRASWPKGNKVADEAAAILTESSHAPYLSALLSSISQFSRPDDPLECAEILEEWGVPKDDVMSMLHKLGLVLKMKILPSR